MSRKRKRDWPQQVYAYDVRVEDGTLPILCRHALLSVTAWNQLVGAWYEQQATAVAGEPREAFWSRWHRRASEILSRSGLPWSDREALADRVLAAIKQGGPKPKDRMDRVCVVHRFTAGGWPAHKLFGRGKLVHLEAPGSKGRTRGCVAVLGQSIAFRVTLHRWLPDGALIKRAELAGREVYATRVIDGRAYPPRWTWKLCLTFEAPPSQATNVGISHPERIAAIDLNWRRMPDGSVRIGVVVDNEAAVRPLTFHAQYVARAKHLRDLHSQMDTTEGREHDRHYREWRGLTCHLIRARRALWRNSAIALCRTYGRLIVEEMDLSEMITEEAMRDAPVALKRGARWRFVVSPSEFRTFLEQAAKKTGTIIDKRPAAYTTIICHRCGTLTENTGRLELTCPRGHRWDQDENAARNLLAAQPSHFAVA